MKEPVISEEEYDRLPVQTQREYKWSAKIGKYVHIDFYVPIKILKRG
jgi:hypothetical protein